jgi:hypothetical protein
MGLHLAQRATINGEILRVYVDGASIDLSIAGDDSIAKKFFFGQAEFVIGAGDKRLQFVECARVEQQQDPLAGS